MQAVVRAFLHQHDLWRPEALLLVAVSGGPDSLALLHGLAQLQAEGGPQLHVAHLDHGVRGAQSAAEAQAVAAWAAAWAIPTTLGTADVLGLAREQRMGLQAAARHARYAFLAATAQALGVDAVAVAHQADDQAETVLLHLMRGSGLAGLRGMLPHIPWPHWVPDPILDCGLWIVDCPTGQYNASNHVGQYRLAAQAGANQPTPPLIRPLLHTPRQAIEAYCAQHGLQPHADPSNEADRFARTRIRRTLRTLRDEQPQLVAALGRTARLAADDYAFIQSQLDAIWPSLALRQPTGLVLQREVWATLHPALQRYALRRAAALHGATELTLTQIERVRQLAAQPGQRVTLGTRLMVTSEAAGLRWFDPTQVLRPLGPQMPVPRLPLTVPGQIALGAGWTIQATDAQPGLSTAPVPGSAWVQLDSATLDGPLELRQRRAGDRLRPAGGRGSRKLQDVLVDCKLDRSLRDAWPILATPHAIVWVVGLRADARFVATAQTQGTIWVGVQYEA